MCGVFGVSGDPEAAKLTYLGLHALQHRGQESAGIVVTADSSEALKRHVGPGLVADVFDESALDRLIGSRSIGHVRYSTAGGSELRNAQPMIAETRRGPMAVAHNGNIVNAESLRQELEDDGSIFSSSSDTEIILHLLAKTRAPRFADRVRQALSRVEGAYSLLILQGDSLIAVRDPSGFRPLLLGKLRDAYVVASETTAFDLIEAEFIREIEPGEMVIIDKNGVASEQLDFDDGIKRRQCIFELVYFARPNSRIFDRDVHEARQELGRQLAREAPVDADIVIPVPDSGVTAAVGYAEEAEIPFRHGLLRSHYVGRTFIEPAQAIRHFGVKLKLSAVRSVLRGKRVIVVDDSLVRGTTSRKLVKMIRAAGATEVHLRISSPPTKFPCFYGIDTPTRKELIASSHTVEEIRNYITADSLAYISEEGLHHACLDQVGDEREFCNACFTGDYSVEVKNERLRVLGS